MADNIAVEVFLVMGSNVTCHVRSFKKSHGKFTNDSPVSVVIKKEGAV